MRLGIAQGLVPRDPQLLTRTLARRIAEQRVEAVVTHFGSHPGSRGTGAERIREIFAAEGIAVAQAAGYSPNLVHPSASVRRVELGRLREGFQAAADLHAESLLTGCGSHNLASPYAPDPLNHSPEARSRLAASLRECARFAEDAGVPLALECHALTTLDTPENVRDILDEVGSEWVLVNFDPVNFIGDLAAAYSSSKLIRRIVEHLGDKLAPFAHVKDVVVEPALIVHPSEAPPGLGLLDFGSFFTACKRLGEGAALIVEHLDVPRTESALLWLDRAMRPFGLAAGAVR